VPDGVEQLNTELVITYGFYAVGIALLARWLTTTSVGRRALVNAPPRRNRMTLFTPLIPFFIWFLGALVLQQVIGRFVGALEGWRELFEENLVAGVASLITIAVMLLLARQAFARGLRGLGLRPRTIPKDLAFAALDLLAVWPVISAMIVVTIAVGKAVLGPEFEMPQHPELEIITETAAFPLRVLIVILAVVVAPLVEEMLFRGFIQTVFRSYLGRPWLAIFLTAVLFASVHINRTHWPALFALAVGLGYSYEKSGSLFRPIFMHALFNGIVIASALAETPPA
jgi:membrane protease YdiL (CAAX protease family)